MHERIPVCRATTKLGIIHSAHATWPWRSALYTTCTFCNRSLGTNEILETFPVGGKLAFDSATGRLWVVCAHCAKWNLTPLESRWEAIESAERIFRAAPLRQSTDNIGLARHASGTSLIRIGKPQRREFASWRYSSNFVARHRRMLLSIGSVAAATTGGLLLVPAATAAFTMLMAASTAGATAALMKAGGGRVRFGPTLLQDDEGQYLQLGQDLHSIKIHEAEDGWAMRVPFLSRRPTLDRLREPWFRGVSYVARATRPGRHSQAAANRQWFWFTCSNSK